jgi:hypothetical protein
LVTVREGVQDPGRGNRDQGQEKRHHQRVKRDLERGEQVSSMEHLLPEAEGLLDRPPARTRSLSDADQQSRPISALNAF